MGVAVAGVPIREVGLVLLVAAAVTYLSTGVVRSVLVRAGKVAEIRTRDVHTQPTPSMGGAAMYTGFLLAIFVAHQLPALTRGFQPITPEMNAVIWAGLVIVIVGVIDDLYELDAITKLVGQILSAVVLSILGVSWTLVYLPFGENGTTLVLDQVQATIVTVIFTVTLMNAVNFVDGLDGLAAGLGMIAGLSLLVFALSILYDQGGTVSAYPPAIIAAVLVGICLGILPHNFEPSRIFMGDTGAMLIGLLLAAASTSASGKINGALYGVADVVALISPLVVVVAVVFIPVLDLVMVVIRRLASGKSPFSADKQHLHHRLLRMGHTHRRVVLVLYLWTGVVAFGAIAFSLAPPLYAVAGTVLAAVAAGGVTLIPVRHGTLTLPGARTTQESLADGHAAERSHGRSGDGATLSGP